MDADSCFTHVRRPVFCRAAAYQYIDTTLPGLLCCDVHGCVPELLPGEEGGGGGWGGEGVKVRHASRDSNRLPEECATRMQPA